MITSSYLTEQQWLMTWDENVSYLLHRYWLISEDLFCNLFILLHLLTPVHWICLLQLLKSLFLLLEHICGLYTSSNTLGSAATTSPVRPAMGGGICGWLFHSALISSCLADEACCTVTESSACVWVVNQWFHPFAPHLCFPPHEKHLRMTAQRKVVIALWFGNGSACLLSFGCWTQTFVSVSQPLCMSEAACHEERSKSLNLLSLRYFGFILSFHRQEFAALKPLRNFRNVASHVFVWCWLLSFSIPALSMYAFCLH